MTIELARLPCWTTLSRLPPMAPINSSASRVGRVEWRRRLDRLGSSSDQLARQRREIVDEIERVLDFVRDAGGELAERGELLRLDEAVLRLAQVVERGGELLASGPAPRSNSRAFSIAITAWSAKARTISIWRSVNGDRLAAGRARKRPRPALRAKAARQQGAVVADPRPLAEIVFRDRRARPADAPPRRSA